MNLRLSPRPDCLPSRGPWDRQTDSAGSGSGTACTTAVVARNPQPSGSDSVVVNYIRSKTGRMGGGAEGGGGYVDKKVMIHKPNRNSDMLTTTSVLKPNGSHNNGEKKNEGQQHGFRGQPLQQQEPTNGDPHKHTVHTHMNTVSLKTCWDPCLQKSTTVTAWPDKPANERVAYFKRLYQYNIVGNRWFAEQ